MSRKYNIRWSEADEAELKRVVKNFNAKLTRLEKKDPKNANALPERISAAQLRDMIETRQDLNRELNALRRFSERGAEELVEVPDNDYNLKITKWQKKEMTRREVIVNQKRKRQLERVADIEMTSRGQSLGYKKGDIGMGKMERIELEPVRAFTPSQNRRDVNKRFRQLRKESISTYWDKRNELMRSVYVNEIEKNFPQEMVKDVVDKIREMDFDEFRKVFEAEDQHKFQFNYPLNKDDQTKYSNALRAIWMPNK
jgi:hypothetical protein